MNRRLQFGLWTAAAIGMLVAIAGWILDPAGFYRAWLAAFFTWLALPLGSLALVFIHALTGGRWGYAIRPALRAAIGTTPLILVGAIPLVLGFGDLFPWARPDIAATLRNGFYLNTGFFFIRMALYLAIWLALAVFSLRAVAERDPDPSLRALAPPGLILLAFTMTFAAIDWTLSLEPTFNSSVYGLLIMAGQVLFALALSVVATIAVRPRDAGVTADLAKLLLGMVLLWAYLEFMQLLIVWESDLTAEIPWYLHRISGGWGAVALVLAAAHFIAPFALLLAGRFQRRPRLVGSVALLLIVMEIVDVWWLVLPSLAPGGVGWIDAAAMLGVGGAWVSAFVFTVQRPFNLAPTRLDIGAAGRG